MAIKTIQVFDLDGSSTRFPVTFEYLARKFVQVTLLGEGRRPLNLVTEFVFETPTQVRTLQAWGAADGYTKIEIRRETSAVELIVSFNDATVLRAGDLNIATVQSLHIAEEARDASSATIPLDTAGNLDAQYRRIVNLAPGINPQDAVNKAQYDADKDGVAQAVLEAKEAAMEAQGSTAEARALRADLLADGGGDRVGYKVAAPSALSRKLGQRILESRAVTDFPTVKAAVEETTNGEILVPPGSYPLTFPANTVGINVGEGTTIKGTGGVIELGYHNYRPFGSTGKSNIRYDSVRMRATSTAGNDAMSAIYAEVNDSNVKDFSVTNSSLVDTSWGALVQGMTGTGYFFGPRFIGNYVESIMPGTRADGLHMVGRVIGGVAVGNAVIGRADAALAFNADAANVGYGGVATGGAHIDCLVGMDVSGQQYNVVSGMNLTNTYPHLASNPCFRAIKYSGSLPKYTMFSAMMALGDHSRSGEFDGKVDAEGEDVWVDVSNVMMRSFWTNAGHVSLVNCRFIEPLDSQNAGVTIAQYAGHINIGANFWDARVFIYGPTNPGLSGHVNLERQSYDRTPGRQDINFLPYYSSTYPFWCSTWSLATYTRTLPVTNFTASVRVEDAAPVPGGTFHLNRACLLGGLVSLADVTTHTGHLQIINSEGDEVVRYDFGVTPGAGGTNVVPGQSFPAVSGNPYYPRLPVGTYTCRVWSDLGAITIKGIELEIYD